MLRKSARTSARAACSRTMGADWTRLRREKDSDRPSMSFATGTMPSTSSVSMSLTGSQENPVWRAKASASSKPASASSQFAFWEGVMIKRAVLPLRRMTRPTMSLSSGAKAAPSVTLLKARASMEAEFEEVLPPSMPRMTLAVASRMSRMLTRRRLLRKAYWLQNSIISENRMAV